MEYVTPKIEVYSGTNTVDAKRILTPFLNAPDWSREGIVLIIFDHRPTNPLLKWGAIAVLRTRIVGIVVPLGRNNDRFSIVQDINLRSVIQVNLCRDNRLLNRSKVHIEHVSGGTCTHTSFLLPRDKRIVSEFMNVVHKLRS